jgi:hypothetical protein
LPQVCPGTPACAFRMSNVLYIWHMRGVFQDMLLYGGVLLARAAGEAAGGKFFAGEGRRPNPPPETRDTRENRLVFDTHWLRGALGMRRCLDVTLGTAFSRFRSPPSAQFAFLPSRSTSLRMAPHASWRSWRLADLFICLAHICRQICRSVRCSCFLVGVASPFRGTSCSLFVFF